MPPDREQAIEVVARALADKGSRIRWTPVYDDLGPGKEPFRRSAAAAIDAYEALLREAPLYDTAHDRVRDAEALTEEGMARDAER